jgi:hypothetical protein
MVGAASTSRGNIGAKSAESERSAARDQPKSKICEAFSTGVADGVRLYIPNSIAILAIGIPMCALASFAHFVLGVSPPATGAVGGASAIAYVVKQIVP